MSDILSYTVNGQEFYHHGIKGMKWGIRRFQTKDGSLTPAGKKRYVTYRQAVRNADNAAKDARKASLAESKATDSGIGSYRRAMKKASAAGKEAGRNSIAKDKAYNKQLRAEKKNAKENPETEHKGLTDKQKKALKVGAAVAGAALAAYGAKKFHDYIRDENGKLAAEAGRKAIKEASNWASTRAMDDLSREYLNMGKVREALEIESKNSKIVVDHAIGVQRNIENLKFGKAVANVYLNKKR